MSINMSRFEVERDEKWMDVAKQMPFISFPADWQIKMIPPLAGAMARFLVLLPDGREKSIYADFYDSLGYYGEPYWEIYPVEGDIARCPINAVTELLAMIEANS